MDQDFLYRQIAESIRQDILQGKLQPGDRLPSMRSLMKQWRCTQGTIQRAYQELAQQGLVLSQAGRGTHVASALDARKLQAQAPLRRAGLVHRAEAFLLETLTAGYDLEEIRAALDLALDRWRSLQKEEPVLPNPKGLRFSGSHDMALVWIASHITGILSGVSMQLQFSGSLGGLMALAEGKADLAGCHLLDVESNTYNEPFIRKLFPGKSMLLTRLANRRIGLIVAPGNPLGLQGAADLERKGVRFVNRQSGSGTRVWLDAALQANQLDAARIDGYEDERLTHSEVARVVAEGQADAGLGLESAAAAFSLGFVPLVEECYDLVTYASLAGQEPLKSLLSWLASPAARESLGSMRGYDCKHSGEQRSLVL